MGRLLKQRASVVPIIVHLRQLARLKCFIAIILKLIVIKQFEKKNVD